MEIGEERGKAEDRAQDGGVEAIGERAKGNEEDKCEIVSRRWNRLVVHGCIHFVSAAPGDVCCLFPS